MTETSDTQLSDVFRRIKDRIKNKRIARNENFQYVEKCGTELITRTIKVA